MQLKESKHTWDKQQLPKSSCLHTCILDDSFQLFFLLHKCTVSTSVTPCHQCLSRMKKKQNTKRIHFWGNMLMWSLPLSPPTHLQTSPSLICKVLTKSVSSERMEKAKSSQPDYSYSTSNCLLHSTEATSEQVQQFQNFRPHKTNTFWQNQPQVAVHSKLWK